MSDETVIEVKEEVKASEKPVEQVITMTPELASFIEKQANEKLSAHESKKEEEMNAFKEQYKKDFLAEQEQLKIDKEKEGLISQITANEDLKKKFDDFGIDYNTIDNQNLTNYVKIWGIKKAENTATPEGQKVSPKVGTVKDAIKGANDKMKELFNRSK